MGSFAGFMAQAIETLVFKPLAWAIDVATDILKEIFEERVDAAKRFFAGKGEGDSSQTKPPVKKP
jgi:hypothetical protein